MRDSLTVPITLMVNSLKLFLDGQKQGRVATLRVLISKVLDILAKAN